MKHPNLLPLITVPFLLWSSCSVVELENTKGFSLQPLRYFYMGSDRKNHFVSTEYVDHEGRTEASFRLVPRASGRLPISKQMEFSYQGNHDPRLGGIPINPESGERVPLSAWRNAYGRNLPKKFEWGPVKVY
jgi:hypothetical protein